MRKRKSTRVNRKLMMSFVIVWTLRKEKRSISSCEAEGWSWEGCAEGLGDKDRNGNVLRHLRRLC